MSERKYLPTLADLIDRLSILQLKEVFLPDHREEYAKEIQDILYDIDIIIQERSCSDYYDINATLIRDIIILAQYNLHIWHNESEARKGNKDGNNLFLTHSLNGIRSKAKDKIQEAIGGRTDPKVDCIAAEHSQWEPSGYETK